MKFKDAANFVMPFGIHKDKKFDKIAETDSGLKYLDWLSGRDNIYGNLRDALTAYLSDKHIAKDLAALLED